MKNLDLRKIKKTMLGKKRKQNRRVPLFATIRSKREVSDNPERRNWRTQKLKLSRSKIKMLGEC
ncbi:MAG: 50S ribosomal protein L39e [Candidatus Micrarchaeia archaeon]